MTRAANMAAQRAILARKAAIRAQGDREAKPGWKYVAGVVHKGKFKPHKHRREIARRLRQLPLVREGRR